MAAGVKSTLKMPPAKALARYHHDQIGVHTVGDYLGKGFSLAICCRGCSRLIEWTPYDLVGRYGDRRDLRIAAIAKRLKCSGDEGCGSEDIAVFPHLYDGEWRDLG